MVDVVCAASQRIADKFEWLVVANSAINAHEAERGAAGEIGLPERPRTGIRRYLQRPGAAAGVTKGRIGKAKMASCRIQGLSGDEVERTVHAVDSFFGACVGKC